MSSRRLAALTCALCLAAWPAAAAAAPRATENVILVTLDGVRIQELFGGMDAALAARPERSGIYDLEATRERYWRATPEERREALMPRFWRELAPQGVVLGNAAKGSRVRVENDQWFSYPGYSEILTGRPQPDVKSNDFVRYPHRTVLEHLRAALGLAPTEVAQFGSWDGFAMAAASADGAFFMNGAYERVPAELSTPEMDELATLRSQVQQFWEESSNDVLTFRLALAYLRRHGPRVLWLGLGQSDDWAHARRYDLLLDYLHLADGLLWELWTTLESDSRYRGRTTLILTTDHGRGQTPKNWTDHDAGIQGSQDIWIAVIGPDTPNRGELENAATVHQGDVAATMVRLLGLDPREFDPGAGPPIAAALAEP